MKALVTSMPYEKRGKKEKAKLPRKWELRIVIKKLKLLRMDETPTM